MTEGRTEMEFTRLPRSEEDWEATEDPWDIGKYTHPRCMEISKEFGEECPCTMPKGHSGIHVHRERKAGITLYAWNTKKDLLRPPTKKLIERLAGMQEKGAFKKALELCAELYELQVEEGVPWDD